MARAMATLDVWLHDRRAGRLSQDRGRLSFAYGDDYLSRGGPALSQSLPLREEPFDDVETESWFANLLPEGRVRRAAARDADVSEGNDFGLLAQLGGECAGAVSLVRAGERPGGPDHPGRVRWLDRAAIGMAIESLPRRPLMADPDGDVRISLAGAQDKLVVVAEGERIGLPVGSTPSSHIVKPPIEGSARTGRCGGSSRASGGRRGGGACRA
jgi:serine/threonine-protein kinase HipA